METYNIETGSSGHGVHADHQPLDYANSILIPFLIFPAFSLTARFYHTTTQEVQFIYINSDYNLLCQK